MFRCEKFVLFVSRPNFIRIADVPTLTLRLRSSNSEQLIVPSFNRTTVGWQAFPVFPVAAASL